MKKIVLLLLSIIIIYGCRKKPQDPMPTLGHTGSNEVACRANGHTFDVIDGERAPRPGFLTGSPSAMVRATYEGGMCMITVLQQDHELSMQFKFSGATGTYPILADSAGTSTLQASASWLDKPNNYYTANTLHPGTVTVTYFDSSIIAGTFTFIGIYEKSFVDISDGQFDIRLRR